jgi:1-acyl-sn-glycerol-3-phosphate acyltransferase
MRLNPFAVLKEHESPRGAEAGVDPLPLDIGPLDPLYKAWPVLGAWPLAVGMQAVALGAGVAATSVVPWERFMPLLPGPLVGAVPLISLSKRTITYHPRFQHGRVSMFMMNHTSILDAHVACWAIRMAFCGIQHEHHFNVPVYGWLMKKGNGIGVTKGGAGQAEKIAAQVRDRVERKISILGFPEGRRTQNGRILPFRRGMFIIARDAGIPVVPLCVRGLWQILRKGEWVVRPGELDVFVGPQIETAGLSDDEVGALADRFCRFTTDYVERGILGDAEALGKVGG